MDNLIAMKLLQYANNQDYHYIRALVKNSNDDELKTAMNSLKSGLGDLWGNSREGLITGLEIYLDVRLV